MLRDLMCPILCQSFVAKIYYAQVDKMTILFSDKIGNIRVEILSHEYGG